MLLLLLQGLLQTWYGLRLSACCVLALPAELLLSQVGCMRVNLLQPRLGRHAVMHHRPCCHMHHPLLSLHAVMLCLSCAPAVASCQWHFCWAAHCCCWSCSPRHPCCTQGLLLLLPQ
jgi:hypothetical protein